MNILICDDDERDILKLRKMIEEYGRQSSMEVSISEFVSGKKKIKQNSFFLCGWRCVSEAL